MSTAAGFMSLTLRNMGKPSKLITLTSTYLAEVLRKLPSLSFIKMKESI